VNSNTRAALMMMIALSPAVPDRSHEILPKLDHWAIVQRIRFNGARNARRNKCELKPAPLKHRRTWAACPACSIFSSSNPMRCTEPGVPATKVR
jgi:hypothetical protein